MTIPARYEVRALTLVYDLEKKRSVAIGANLQDAEQIVSALNSVIGLRDLVQELQSDRDRYKRLYGPPERYEGS
jgi:hypothetical protein